MSHQLISVLLLCMWFSNLNGDSNFFVIKKLTDSKYFCVTNSSFALSWIQHPVGDDLFQVSNFIPSQTNNFDCRITEKNKCTSDYVKKPWILKKSLGADLILDRRWEGMNILKTDHAKNFSSLTFRKILSSLGNNFEIPFSLRTENEAHIFLCDGEEPPKSNCYWFLLQAWNGRASAIRKCGKNSISNEIFTYPVAPCSDILYRIHHPSDSPLYFSDEQWSHFKLVKEENRLSLNKKVESGFKEILKLKDKSEIINIKHMMVHSKYIDALWKVHQLEYIFTDEENDGMYLGPPIQNITENSLCISMFVSMCPSCSLKLAVVGNERTLRRKLMERIYSTKGTSWSEIKVVMDNIQNSLPLRLQISTTGNSSDRFWAIDDVRQCQKKEYRIISLNCEAKCQLMSGQNNIVASKEMTDNLVGGSEDVQIGLKNDISCPKDTNGNGELCALCNWLPYTDCLDVKILSKYHSVESRCFCSFGNRTSSMDSLGSNERSEPPYDLESIWTSENNLQINWRYSNRSHGKIRYFMIALIPQLKNMTAIYKQFLVTEETYNLTYYHSKINSSDLLPTTEYIISVWAFDGYDGERVTKTVTSPPELPSLNKAFKATVTEEAVILQLSVTQPRGFSDFCSVTVLLSNQSINITSLKLQNFEIDKHIIVVSAQNITDFSQSLTITLQNGDEYREFLKPEIVWNIILRNTYKNRSSVRTYSYNNYFVTKHSYDMNFLFLLLLLMIPIVAVTLIIRQNHILGRPLIHVISLSGIKRNRKNNNRTELSYPVKTKNFEQYVKNSENCGALDRQYALFASEISKTIYETMEQTQWYDYIDLEYNNGTKIKKAYIISEIPKKDDISEFWKYIWEDNVENIVLFGDGGENARYWPEGSNKIECSGVSVLLLCSKDFEFYTHRKYVLFANDIVKRVEQIQCAYSGRNPRKFVSFFRKMLKISLKTTSPVLIHSSTGIGGVGFVLLCDMTLRIAGKEKIINVMANLRKLSNYKSGMVRNVEQYKLVHAVICQVLFGPKGDWNLKNDYINV